MSAVEACARCGAALKSGVFSSNTALSAENIKLINLAHDVDHGAGCLKCSGPLYESSWSKLRERLGRVRREAEALLDAIPLASLSLPFGWEYQTIGLVTAQTVTGTGLFSDVTSAFTDLFGAQSGAYNNKLRTAEDQCRASLRAQTLQYGGNAVLGVDVDYAEVGGQRAMLMVCMTGTAVRVIDEQALGEGVAERIQELRARSEQVHALTQAAVSAGVS